ncbi:hypothetical protein HPP92_024711 [Vanilla planifolia]|uniref:Exostosin GT47 domain-containing protein n=1 Tax=Vanilla planifolia TaxID=51239 RepID=A0A835PLB7_VANPL|nr:hypothetical protein HPP92_024711 [Vanilla planifolia]
MLLRSAVSFSTTRRRQRGRRGAANWWPIILSAALLAAALTAFLARALPPLPISIVSILHTSAASPITNSTVHDEEKHTDGGQKFTSMIRAEMITMEAEGGNASDKMSNSTKIEAAVNELPSIIGVPSSSKLERYRKEVQPHNHGQKIPFWVLPPDEAMLYAKREIEHAPLITDDPDVYAPAFWNLSAFRRSYELMERILKVYVYADGSRPIFHKPELQGIYASEGWFMKLMEESRQFHAKDPEKAHLFYLPYSSRQLRDVLYIPGSHNLRPLAIFLRDYVNSISSKYPFWNRTRGSNHFLVACHDWGPYSTTLHTELRKNTIKALCNADSSEGIFMRGRDVSLPETSIKVPKRPLKYVGRGKPVTQRPILAFYAGSMHGRVRPTLEKLWGKNANGDMRIFRRLPNRVSRNMSYIEHMKSSRFCICPMGYEVNSPRIVEAIYYECVPVIIADNFVLPFEEVLNWNTFSVVVAEKDMANLKNILLGITLKRYLKMQECVKKVQKHFLWHSRPEKYDLFHMILHSIWLSRLHQI